MALAPSRRSRPDRPAPSTDSADVEDGFSVDVTSVLERKVAALAAHRSQYAMDPDLLPRSMLERLLGTEHFVVAVCRKRLSPWPDPEPDRHDARTDPASHDRAWVLDAIACIEADLRRSADTHLVTFPLPSAWGIDLYLKDESTHPTGSLKHRLARSLFLYGLCNGWIDEGVTIIEASSGSTAVSEAYFARMLGLPFVAVVPATDLAGEGGPDRAVRRRCHVVDDASSIYAEAARLAAECGGVYLDQFTYAERATDWRGNNNIAESIFEQMALERHPVPTWVVVGAGTGGTVGHDRPLHPLLPGDDAALRRRPTRTACSPTTSNRATGS